MSKIDDKELHELFCKLKENDKLAYEQLYKEFSQLVYRISFSILKDKENAEDVMQNVFIKLSNLSKEKLPSKYEASWLYSVTKNEAITYLRKNKITVPIEEVDKKEKEDELEELMQKDSYEKMLSFLENKDKQIVSLKVELGLSFKEISSLLNMPIGTVQWKYYKSLHSLKLLIGNLSLFIITATLCITNLLKNEKNIVNREEIVEKKEDIENDNLQIKEYEKIKDSQTLLINDVGETQASLTNRLDEAKGEVSKIEKDIIGSNTIENNVTQTQEVIDANENYEINFAQIVLISLTSVFLSLTILFAIVYATSKQRKK